MAASFSDTNIVLELVRSRSQESSYAVQKYIQLNCKATSGSNKWEDSRRGAECLIVRLLSANIKALLICRRRVCGLTSSQTHTTHSFAQTSQNHLFTTPAHPDVMVCPILLCYYVTFVPTLFHKMKCLRILWSTTVWATVSFNAAQHIPFENITSSSKKGACAEFRVEMSVTVGSPRSNPGWESAILMFSKCSSGSPLRRKIQG
jgi:hypothetical protein